MEVAMKKGITVAMVFFAVVVLLFAGKNYIAKTGVTKGVKAVTGLSMEIGSMDVGILDTFVDIQGLILFNPPEFTEKIMVNIPEFHVDYNLVSFLGGKTHLEEVTINLQKLNVIKDKKGNFNIDSLRVVQEQKAAGKPAEQKKSSLMIEVLELLIGKVVYTDYSTGTVPKTYEFDINVHEKFHNITDVQAVGKLILVKALMGTNLADLAQFEIGSIASDVSGTLKKVTEAGKPVRDTGSKAKSAIEDTVKGVQEKLKLPLGK